MNEFLLEAFPNPERIGCPDEEKLKAFAEGRLSPDDLTGLHVGSCSECYAEYRHYYLDWKEANNAQASPTGTDAQTIPVETFTPSMRKKQPRSSFSRTFLAIAASLILAFIGLVAYRYEHHAGRGAQMASNEPVSARVDLFNAPALRGTGDGAAPLQQVMLPAAVIHLALTLPRFSHAGQYNVVVSYDRNGQNQVAQGTGTAVESNGRVGLEVTLDLRAAKAGAYFLATVRGSDNGTYYYPLQVK